MIIFDAHLDLAWNAIDWNRDLRLPVADVRKSETDQGLSGKGLCSNTVSFSELRKGKICIFVATVMSRHRNPALKPSVYRYSTMEAAYAAAYGQLAYYRGLEQAGYLRWIKDATALEAHVKAWKEAEGKPGGTDKLPLGYIISMEGADPVLRPDQIEEWFQAGVRALGPAHYGISPYAHGTGTVGGLFEQGPALLKEMQRVGMILDVTHLSDQCFDEALDIYGGPILASHHNCRALVPDQRQLTDDQINRLIARNAVIGACFDCWMLYPNWIRGESKPDIAGIKIDTVVDHIDRVCQLAGNSQHAAIGSDLDGGYGREQSPADLDTIADLQRVSDLLRRRGYKPDAIDNIMHGNWLRFYKNALPRK